MILIAYFSHSGNTEVIANQIREYVGGDVFGIATVDPYPSEYDAVVKVAAEEKKNAFRPKLSRHLERAESFDAVFIGYPNWWSTMPMAVFAFLEQQRFPGKSIAPFCTHEGSGLGRSVQDLRKLCPQAVILEGLAIRGGVVRSAEKSVKAWIDRIGIRG